MKNLIVNTLLKPTAMAVSVLVLTGCASVNFDQAVSDTNLSAGAFTGGNLELSRTTEQQSVRAKLASR